MHVEAEEVSGQTGTVRMHWRGTGLDKKDFFGKSDPFYTIGVENASGSFSVVHQSETIMKTLNPTWRPMSIPLQQLCNGDRDRRLQIICYDWDSDGNNDLIGVCTTTLNELVSEGLGKDLALINAKKMPGGKKAKKGYKNSGELHLLMVDTCSGGASVYQGVAFVP